MKKQLLLFAMILLPLVASAETVEINGIYYNLVSKIQEAEVTSNPNTYTGNVVIPEKVTYENVEYSVTSIGINAFQFCSVTSVTIPNSVTSIGNNAFLNCTDLRKVIVKDIAAWCGIKFDGSYSNPLTFAKHLYSDEDTEITNLIIPNSVTSIGNRAFYGCSGLTSVSIPNSVTSIGESAFRSCSGLTSITIPNSVTSIGLAAFGRCSGLTSVTIPNSVTSIGESAFYRCSGLTSVTIPNSVTSIGHGAFSECSGLTSITIPNSVTSIESSAFYGCSGLTSITIPNSVTSIGESAFSGCSGLTSITIGSGVTSIGHYAFDGCSGLTSVTIGSGVTSIGFYAFQNCSGLTSVTIPNSVTSIGEYAFYRCSGLTSVTIGNGINNIYGSAFASCPELTDVTCYAENVPNTGNDAFIDSYIEYATLHVPASAVNAYKAAAPWKNFKSIMATDGTTPETPETPKCEKPTISYENGQLKMSCATEGVEYVTDITDADIKKHYDATISLTATYTISVYAIKSGYDNSETATATLCWIDQQPKTEGITNGIANIPAQAVLIQSEGGSIKVQGVDEGTQVNVYSINGTQAGSAISQSGAATINTNLQPGSIAIVKIGQKSVKVAIK